MVQASEAVVSPLEACQVAVVTFVALNFDQLGLRYPEEPAASVELAVAGLPALPPAAPGSVRRTAPEPEAGPLQQSWLAETLPTAATVAAANVVVAETSKPTPGSPVVREHREVRASAIAG